MFTHDKFNSMNDNSKLFFKLVNNILGRRQQLPYPDFTDNMHNVLDSFFNEKNKQYYIIINQPSLYISIIILYYSIIIHLLPYNGQLTV